MNSKLTAALFAEMVRSGANNLANHRSAVDALNVFPVPDGDTGTNMSLTIRNAAQNLPADADRIELVASAVASYTLRGARGNSGVILSQIFRGIANRAKGKDCLTTKEFTRCLKDGCDSAYRAVMKPTEGTILTVIRSLADAAAQTEEEDFTAFFSAIVAQGNETLLKTTDMLPALRQAGVVDAGGKGLMTIFEGMLAALSGDSFAPDAAAEQPAEIAPQASIRTEDIRFTYCTEFIINKSVPSLRADKLKNAIGKIGDCMVVIDDEDIIKVHIHTNNPGFVLEQAVLLGELATVKIENMKIQHSDIVNPPDASASAPPVEHTKSACLAVAAGEGVAALFEELGAAVIPGGQTMNPSTEDILSALSLVSADTVYVLPNNSNIILAAQQAAQIAEVPVVVIPTKTVPQGISAMLSFDPEAESADNELAMTAAAERVTTGLVTHAVRDTVIDGKDIHDGDALGLVEKDIVSVGSDVTETAKDLLTRIVTEDTALITVLFGDSVTEDDAAALSEFAEEHFPDCEISVCDGKMPVYSYILSAE